MSQVQILSGAYAQTTMTPVDLLLIIGEIEGVIQHAKKLGFEDDLAVLEPIQRRYYKMYYQLKKSS